MRRILSAARVASCVFIVACETSEPLVPTPSLPSEVDAAVSAPPLDGFDAAVDVPPDGAAPYEGQVTYTKDVRPILARACVPCHSEGQIAPFSLDTYERASTFAPLIATATRARTMPPSVIDNSGDCNTFPDIPWLTDQEIDLLGEWAEQQAPEGDPTLPAPEPHLLPTLAGEVKTIKTPSYVPSTKQRDDYRCFVIESPFEENTFVTGYDTHPGDKKTAHHMVVFYPMDDLSALWARILDDSEEGPGYTCFGAPGVPAGIIAAWAPGGGATNYPAGLGIPVVPKRPIIVQMHYNTSGVSAPGADSTAIDLQIKKDGIPAMLAPMLDLDMNLPPGQKVAEETVLGKLADKVQRQGPVEVYGVFPHMHELGKNLKVSISNAKGEERCLIDAPRYQFHWQRLYFFDEPITVDAADQLKVHCRFDTTSRSEVTNWGEGTQDEMCVAGVFVKL